MSPKCYQYIDISFQVAQRTYGGGEHHVHKGRILCIPVRY